MDWSFKQLASFLGRSSLLRILHLQAGHGVFEPGEKPGCPWEAKDEQKDPPAESQQKGCSPFAFLPGDFHVHLDEGPRARGE